jgi:AAA+ superfamily predicted ATPase
VHRLIRGLFDVQIEIPLPNEGERREILKRKIVAAGPYPAFDVDEVCSALAGLTTGMSGRDMDRIVYEARHFAVDRCPREGSSDAVLTREDLFHAAQPRY